MSRFGNPETLEEAIAVMRDGWFRQGGKEDISYQLGGRIVRAASIFGGEIRRIHQDAIKKGFASGEQRSASARDGDPSTLQEAVDIIGEAWTRHQDGIEISYEFGSRVIASAAAWGREIHNLHYDGRKKDLLVDHPMAIKAPKLDRARTIWPSAPRRFLPHMLTRASFVGRQPVVEEKNYTGFHYGCMQQTRAMMLKASAETGWLRSSFRLDGFEFWVRGDEVFGFGDVVAAFADRNSEIVGGINQGTLWVEPGARRKGVGAAMILCGHYEQAYTDRRFLAPTSYSVEGHKAHLSAHRKAVEIALAAGEEIDDEILADYPELARKAGAPTPAI